MIPKSIDLGGVYVNDLELRGGSSVTCRIPETEQILRKDKDLRKSIARLEKQ